MKINHLSANVNANNFYDTIIAAHEIYTYFG